MTLIDSSLQQRHVPMLLRRVRLELRISYLLIANVQRLSRVAKHAQARNDIMLSSLVDSVEALNKFGPDAWDRVVCVLTTGQVLTIPTLQME